MDLALYDIGLYMPTILSIISVGGESPAGLQPWLGKDIRLVQGSWARRLAFSSCRFLRTPGVWRRSRPSWPAWVLLASSSPRTLALA
jgi:hypothetical protein